MVEGWTGFLLQVLGLLALGFIPGVIIANWFEKKSRAAVEKSDKLDFLTAYDTCHYCRATVQCVIRVPLGESRRARGAVCKSCLDRMQDAWQYWEEEARFYVSSPPVKEVEDD